MKRRRRTGPDLLCDVRNVSLRSEIPSPLGWIVKHPPPPHPPKWMGVPSDAIRITQKCCNVALQKNCMLQKALCFPQYMEILTLRLTLSSFSILSKAASSGSHHCCEAGKYVFGSAQLNDSGKTNWSATKFGWFLLYQDPRTNYIITGGFFYTINYTITILCRTTTETYF
jgi:hypothetical protein